MSPKGSAAPAATGTSGAKKAKGPIERLNKKAAQVRDWLQKLVKLADATRTGISAEDSALDRAMVEISFNGEEALTSLESVIAGLGMAHKEKWDPKKAPRNFFAPESLVAIRSSEIKKLDGAYEKEDLGSLRVVSLHGKKAKVEIFRDDLAGECLGLIPLRWLQARE